MSSSCPNPNPTNLKKEQIEEEIQLQADRQREYRAASKERRHGKISTKR